MTPILTASAANAELAKARVPTAHSIALRKFRCIILSLRLSYASSRTALERARTLPLPMRALRSSVRLASACADPHRASNATNLANCRLPRGDQNPGVPTTSHYHSILSTTIIQFIRRINSKRRAHDRVRLGSPPGFDRPPRRSLPDASHYRSSEPRVSRSLRRTKQFLR